MLPVAPSPALTTAPVRLQLRPGGRLLCVSYGEPADRLPVFGLVRGARRHPESAPPCHPSGILAPDSAASRCPRCAVLFVAVPQQPGHAAGQAPAPGAQWRLAEVAQVAKNRASFWAYALDRL